MHYRHFISGAWLSALGLYLGLFFGLSLTAQANITLQTDQSLCVEWLPGCEGGDIPFDFRDSVFFTDIAGNIVDFAIILIGGGSVAVLVLASLFLLAGGYSDELYQRAIRAIIWALVGFLVAVFAFFIVDGFSRLPFPGV